MLSFKEKNNKIKRGGCPLQMMQRHFKRYRHLLKWNIPLKATCGNGGKKTVWKRICR